MNEKKKTDVLPALPLSFKERISGQIKDSSLLFKYLDLQPRTTVRLNQAKISLAENLPMGEPVPWNEDGIYLDNRPSFLRRPDYHAGLYYPMEASSMFLDFILKQIPLRSEDIILDLCAAPGGKSLILKDQFRYNLLVSNEIESKRAHILKENSIRWGTDDHLVIQSDAKKLSQSGVQFDLVLVDAPCSGEGLFRKDPDSRLEWSVERASGCGIRQEQILDDAATLLAPGGTIIYSTCTFNPEENMDQVVRFARKYHCEPRIFNFSEHWNIEAIEEEGFTGYQFWPHWVDGEGFFIAVLQHTGIKTGAISGKNKIREAAFPYLPEIDLSEFWIQLFQDRFYALTTAEVIHIELLRKFGNIIKRGIFLGEKKGADFIPSYDLAMHPIVHEFKNQMPLSEQDALKFLSGQALPIKTAKGPVLLTHEGLPLGFGKSNQQRINNLYPKHLRIPPTF